MLPNRWETVKCNAYQTLIAFDQLCNAGIGLVLSLLRLVFCWPKPVGIWYADETISSHSWRWYRDGTRYWPKKIINGIFFLQENHCKEAFESELYGRQLPPECRPKDYVGIKGYVNVAISETSCVESTEAFVRSAKDTMGVPVPSVH